MGRLNPRHIILATDFSARCDRPQNRAVQLAIEWNASLTAVHALSDMGLTNHPSLREAYRTAAMRNSDLAFARINLVSPASKGRISTD